MEVGTVYRMLKYFYLLRDAFRQHNISVSIRYIHVDGIGARKSSICDKNSRGEKSDGYTMMTTDDDDFYDDDDDGDGNGDGDDDDNEGNIID